MKFRPTLATDADLNKIRFPVLAFPKIDGVRAVNWDGTMTARSLKPFPSKLLTSYYNSFIFKGFDGELTIGNITDSDLCRRTTSGVMTIESQLIPDWNLFDYVTEENFSKPYVERYIQLRDKYKEITDSYPALRNHLRIVEYEKIYSYNELLEYEKKIVNEGYEGIILRDPNAKYKFNRSTVRDQVLLRLKRFYDAEAVVIDVQEGKENQNEAVKNELGLTSRSTISENMVGNGMVGSLVCKLFSDIEVGNIKFSKDFEFIVSPGKLTHTERQFYFNNKDKIVGRIIKFKFFATGIKDSFRFPTFQTFRDKKDM